MIVSVIVGVIVGVKVGVSEDVEETVRVNGGDGVKDWVIEGVGEVVCVAVGENV